MMAHRVRVTINQQQEQLLDRLAADATLGVASAAEALRHGFREHVRQHPELRSASKPEGSSDER
jgi:hypothetical protein